MKDYAELEKRLLAEADAVFVIPDEIVLNASVTMRAAAAAISDLTKRLEEAYADCRFRALSAIDGERLVDATTDERDDAYSQAVNDCYRAVEQALLSRERASDSK